jgi:hypothetical protein
MRTSQVTDPCALRRIPVGSIPRDIDRVAVARLDAGWRFLFEGRWFTVVGSPDRHGEDVRIWFQGPGVAVVDMATFNPARRFWARPPQDPAQKAQCAADGCPGPGPYTMTDDGPLCIPHLGEHLLAETAGPDDVPEPEAADRG